MSPDPDAEAHRLARLILVAERRARALLAGELTAAGGKEVAALVKNKHATALRLADTVATTEAGIRVKALALLVVASRDLEGKHFVDGPVEALGLSIARDLAGPFWHLGAAP